MIVVLRTNCFFVVSFVDREATTMPHNGHLVNYGFLPVITLQKYEIMIKHASFYAKNCIKNGTSRKARPTISFLIKILPVKQLSETISIFL